MFRNQHYIAEPIHGRRRDFLDGENINEIVNYPIQSSGAALMNDAIIALSDMVPLHTWGPGTGIINQCHDSIVVECPVDKAPWVVERIEDVMNRTHPAFPGMDFSATADVSDKWSEV